MTPAVVTCPAWCPRVGTDHADLDGSVFHHAAICRSELVEVEVTQISHPDGDMEPPTFTVTVHDEPPLTAGQLLQVSGELMRAATLLLTGEDTHCP